MRDIVAIAAAAGLLAFFAWSLARSSDNHYSDDAEHLGNMRVKKELNQIRIHRPDHISQGADDQIKKDDS
jgi:hypothetical protein